VKILETEMTEIPEIERKASIKPTTTSQERTWAAIAHASGVLTLLFSLASAGVLGLFFAFVPLIIYFSYKDKSEYVAFQAAQASALQIVGSIGFFVAILAVTIALVVVWTVTGVLSVILIGLLLIPVALLLTIVLALALAAMPFVLGGFSLVAAVQTADGADYYYPYLGRYVADWLERTRTEPVPSV